MDAVQKPVSRSHSHRTPRTRVRTRTRRGSQDSPDRSGPTVVLPQDNGLTSPMLRRKDLQQPQQSPVSGTKGFLSQQHNGTDTDRRVRRFEVLSREAQATRTKHLKQKYRLDEMEMKNKLGEFELHFDDP